PHSCTSASVGTRDLPFFPTRRSSDLREFFLKEQLKVIKRELGVEEDGKEKTTRTFRERIEAAGLPPEARKIALEELEKFETLSRSEEHTSELQSRENLVCRLLLEKRK